MKKYWDKILLFFSAIGAVAFFVSRFFTRSAPGSTDTEVFANDVIAYEKKRLEQEKAAIVEETKAVDKKEYTDEEIERKYNK
jgi:hypothetical protein